LQIEERLEVIEEIDGLGEAAIGLASPTSLGKVGFAEARLTGKSLRHALLLLRYIEGLAILEYLSIELVSRCDERGYALRHRKLARADQYLGQIVR